MKTDTKNLMLRNGVYYVVHKIDGRKVMKTTGTNILRDARKFRDEYLAPFRLKDAKVTAEMLAAKVASAEKALESIEEEKPATRLSHLWQMYIESPKRPDSGQRTLKDYEQQFNIMLRWMTAHYPKIHEARYMTPKMAVGFIKSLKDEHATPRTITKYLNSLQLIWRICFNDAGLHENIWNKDHITRPKQDRRTGRRNALSLQELDTLLQHAEGDIYDLLTLLAFSGQRLGDVANLRWDAIDLTKGVITLIPRKTARTSGKEVCIPLLPPARDVLEKRMRFPDQVYVMPDIKLLYDQDAGSTLTKQIGKVFDAAGFERQQVRNGRKATVYGAHSLRHTFTTIARGAGLPDAFIKDITGHVTDGMVDHYSHFEGLAAAFGQQVKSLPSDTKKQARIKAMAEKMHNLSDAELGELEESLKTILERGK